MATRQQRFIEEAYDYARQAGLSDSAARVAVAQTALETGYGKSVKGSNYFGIKSGSSWTGKNQNIRTWEEVNGKRVNITDSFRKYENPVDSFKDWGKLMERRFPEVLTAPDFKSATDALNYGKKGGYATDSKYGKKLDFIDRNFTQKSPSFNGGNAANAFAQLPQDAPTPFGPESLLAEAPKPDTMGSGLLSGDFTGNPLDMSAQAATIPNGGISAAQRKEITQPRITYDLAGKARSQVPTSGIGEKVAESFNRVMPDGETVMISGMEPQGRSPFGSPNRHPKGFGGDFDFKTPDGQRITDQRVMHDVAMDMAARHKANIGYSQDGYMGAGRMHIDTMPLDQFPGGAQWGNTGKQWAENLEFARSTGMGPTPLEGPMPQRAPTQREAVDLGGISHPMGMIAPPQNPAISLLSEPQYTGPMQPEEKTASMGLLSAPKPFERSRLSQREIPTANPHQQGMIDLAPTPTARPQRPQERLGIPSALNPYREVSKPEYEGSIDAARSFGQQTIPKNATGGFVQQAAPQRGLLSVPEAEPKTVLGGYSHPMGMAPAPTPTPRPQIGLETRAPHFGQATPRQTAPAHPEAPKGLLGDVLVGSPDLVRNQQFAEQQPDQLLGSVDDISKPLGQAAAQQEIATAPTMGTGVAPEVEPEKMGLMDKITAPKNIGKVGGALAGSLVLGPIGGLLGGMIGGKLGQGIGEGGMLSGLGNNLGFSSNQHQGDLNFVGYGGGQGPMAARYGPAGTAYNDSAGGTTVSNGRGGFTRTNSYGVTEYTDSGGNTSVVSGGQSLVGGLARDMSEAFGGRK